MIDSSTGTDHLMRQRFTGLFETLYAPLFAYCLRRVAGPADAADAVAEVFTVAWRRITDVPAGPDARLWLYGVASRVLANHHRSRSRQSVLLDRLRAQPVSAGMAIEAFEGMATAALGRLSPDDQEILRLSAWEELTPAEIATVIGIRPVSARSRLLRARRRLALALDQPPTPMSTGGNQR